LLDFHDWLSLHEPLLSIVALTRHLAGVHRGVDVMLTTACKNLVLLGSFIVYNHASYMTSFDGKSLGDMVMMLIESWFGVICNTSGNLNVTCNS